MAQAAKRRHDGLLVPSGPGRKLNVEVLDTDPMRKRGMEESGPIKASHGLPLSIGMGYPEVSHLRRGDNGEVAMSGRLERG